MIAKSDRRMFLGMPGYAHQTGPAGEGFWCACEDDTHLKRDGEKNGSLLAANFNSLWCEALNIVHGGGRLDYFAMLHNDIGPGQFWLDKLIDELEAQNLDVLCVAVPIKDGRGLTSLALDRGDNPFRVESRLTMYDVFELPDTFTSDDLGGKPLLLNTGCWVCKFDIAWAQRVHFEINDRIVLEKSSNKYLAENESEDWFFSRQLYELADDPTYSGRPLRIGATRKIKLSHRGELDFENDQPWGTPIDVETVSKSPVPGAFPREIPGWLANNEGQKLGELARGKRVLEIGSFCGRSTVCLARTADSVTAVDYFDGRGTPFPQQTRAEFDRSLARHGVADKVTVKSPDDELAGPYDLIFIDGAHHADAVRADIAKSLSVLAGDGLLCFHDYRRTTDPGVTIAVDELLDDGGELISLTNTLAVVKPPALIPLEV